MLILVMLIDSVISGSELDGPAWWFLYYELIGALIANGVLIAGELFMPEDNVERKRAVRLITRGIFRNLFWGGAVVSMPAILAGPGHGGVTVRRGPAATGPTRAAWRPSPAWPAFRARYRWGWVTCS